MCLMTVMDRFYELFIILLNDFFFVYYDLSEIIVIFIIFIAFQSLMVTKDPAILSPLTILFPSFELDKLQKLEQLIIIVIISSILLLDRLYISVNILDALNSSLDILDILVLLHLLYILPIPSIIDSIYLRF